MTFRKVIFDTNVYIGWLNKGQHEQLMLGRGLVRYLSAVVLMELRVGAKMLPARRALDQLARPYSASGRLFAPNAEILDRAGRILPKLRESGQEIRRASLLGDLLIALSARSLGATVFTADQDYQVIHEVFDFDLEMVDVADS